MPYAACSSHVPYESRFLLLSLCLSCVDDNRDTERYGGIVHGVKGLVSENQDKGEQ